ncbi:hypothetical protein H7X68_01235 [Candidatus Saccharibacteria bacterium]|nr:hypothetical protein [Candidatus Saccharibacteria bacterium]
MIDLECPVEAQRLKSPAELLEGLVVNEITDPNRAERGLKDGDTLTRLECSVADCAVKALIERRKGHGVTTTTFEVENPRLCERAESTMPVSITVQY